MRYLIQLEFYLHADNNEAIMEKVREMAATRDMKFDDQTVVREVHEQPFGSLLSKEIFPNPS